MLVLITYDISVDSKGGARRLRHIAKHCQDYGVRVQYSVFECEITPAQWVILRQMLLDSYDENVDSLRFYMLGKSGRQKIEHHGSKAAIDPFKTPIIL